MKYTLTFHSFKWLLLVVFACMASHLMAQSDSTQPEADTSSGSPIVVINADRTIGFDGGVRSQLIGNVIMRQDSVVIYADTVFLDEQTNRARAKGQVIIQKSDTTNAFCQELDYLGNEERAIMKGDAAVQNGRQRLFGNYITYNMRSNVASYLSTATLTDGEQQVVSRRGEYFMDQDLVVFHDSVVLSGQDYIMRTDSLHYFIALDRADMHAPFRIKQGERDIYAETGKYYLKDQTAELYGQAQFSEPGTKASADTIYFDGPTKDALLIGNARYQADQRYIEADSIDYAISKDRAILSGNVFARDPEQILYGEKIYYGITDQSVEAEGRTNIENGAQQLYADAVQELRPGVRLATGDVVWIDTLNDVRLNTEYVIFDEETEKITSFGEDMRMTQYMDGDSLVMTADTFLLITMDSTGAKELHAFEHVVAYKSDIQFVANEMRFNDQTGHIRMHGDPRVWSDSSIMYADTIVLFIEEEALTKVDLIDKAMLLQMRPYDFYDQIKGKVINAFLNEQVLDEVLVTGNAQSIYYAIDEVGAFVGVNEVDCSQIRLKMGADQVRTIHFFAKPAAQLHPMRSVNHEEIKLEGFNADDTYRSSSPEDIYRVYKLIQVL